ncbi:MAG TPA: phasin family protein [Burkholderiales bacterium]|nr:phasin family protein [Burkholderiales bacterium]
MQDQLVDLYRNGMKSATELARMSLESSVRLQERQLDIARKVLEESTRSVDRVSGAKNMDELLAAQTELAGSQMQRIAEFWTSVWQSAAENQKHLIEQVQSQVGQAAGSFQNLYSAAARSSEDVARTAATQVSRAAGSVRESASAANHERKGQEGHRKSA